MTSKAKTPGLYEIITVAFIAFILTLPVNSFAMEGHNGPSASAEFRVDRADVRLGLDPETFEKGRMPKVVVSLSDHVSGSPVLDAELYILLEKAGAQAGHAGHPGIPASGQAEVAAIDNGLDFGEPAAGPAALDLSLYSRLIPRQMAGMFEADYHLHEKGEYLYTLVVASLDGKRFAEPLVYGGRIAYNAASSAPFYRMAFVISLIVLCGAAGIWIMSLRRAAAAKAGDSVNLLDIPWLRRFVKSAWFQPVFQVPTFVIFMLIIAAGLFDVQQGDRNIATLLMWTIWWAAIIFTFVFVGRIWCMACPFGAAQDWITRFFSLNRDFPRPMRNIYLSSFLFFGLTWWDSYSGIVNKPAMTAFLLLGFFAVAGGMSLVFKGRSFCRYVCPIGGLIGVYSMFSPVELRNKCMEVCRDHKVKECVKGARPGRPCPMFVTPMTLDRNNYCNFCSECVKSCPKDNITIRFRGFAKDLWSSAKGRMDEAYLIMIILGISIVVTGEMVEPWHLWMDALGKLMPFGATGAASHGQAETMTFLFVLTAGSLAVPMLLLLLTAWMVTQRTGPTSPLGLKDTMVRFAYMFVPVGLSMHLAHNISHLVKEGPAIVPAVERALNTYAGFTFVPNWEIAPLMGPESVFWLQMLIVAVLNVFSLYAGYRIAVRHYGDKALRAFVPMAVLAIFFMLINTYILGQPMSLRHTH
jgi:ferredoxin